MQLMVSQGTLSTSPGMVSTAMQLVKQEGFFTLYNGLSASLLRHATYTTSPFVFYLKLKDLMHTEGQVTPWYQKIASGMLAGAGGALVGSPADVVLVRMQADGKLPIEQRRNYNHALDGLWKITKEEGVTQLWRGCAPNVNRGMLMSVGQLASYDQAKQMLLKTPLFKDNITTHFTASLIAAFVAAVITNPFDVIKTRIMNQQKKGTAGNDPQVYANSFDCFRKILKYEGYSGFFKGFVPYFVRLGPQTILVSFLAFSFRVLSLCRHLYSLSNLPNFWITWENDKLPNDLDYNIVLFFGI